MLQAVKAGFVHSDGCRLFKGVNIEIAAGEIVGLPGKSGIGKSTLGLLLAGYSKASEGKILCDGSPLASVEYCPVQLIFQHPEQAVNPRWTIEKILAEGNANYHHYMEQLELPKQWLGRYPHQLSGGELQRISLIRVMNDKTRYIVADEITASLDAATQALIWSNLLNWAKTREVGILAISHDTALLAKICDRVDDSFIGAV